MEPMKYWLEPFINERLAAALPWVQHTVSDRLNAPRNPPPGFRYEGLNLIFKSSKTQTMQIIKMLPSDRLCRVLLSDSFTSIEATISTQSTSYNPLIDRESVGRLIRISSFDIRATSHGKAGPPQVTMLVLQSRFYEYDGSAILGNPKPITSDGPVQVFLEVLEKMQKGRHLRPKSQEENVSSQVVNNTVPCGDDSCNVATQVPFTAKKPRTSMSVVIPRASSKVPISTSPTSLLSKICLKAPSAAPVVTHRSANTSEDLMALVGSKHGCTHSTLRLPQSSILSNNDDCSRRLSVPQEMKALEDLRGISGNGKRCQPKRTFDASPKGINNKPLSPVKKTQEMLSGQVYLPNDDAEGNSFGDLLETIKAPRQPVARSREASEATSHSVYEQNHCNDAQKSTTWEDMGTVLRHDVDIPKDQVKALAGDYSWLPPEPGRDEPMVNVSGDILKWFDEIADASVTSEESVTDAEDEEPSSSSLSKRSDALDDSDSGIPVSNWSSSPPRHRFDELPPDSSAENGENETLAQISGRHKRQRSPSMDEVFSLSEKKKLRRSQLQPPCDPESGSRSVPDELENSVDGVNIHSSVVNDADPAGSYHGNSVLQFLRTQHTLSNDSKLSSQAVSEASQSHVASTQMRATADLVPDYQIGMPETHPDDLEFDSDGASEMAEHVPQHGMSVEPSGHIDMSQVYTPTADPVTEPEESYVQVHRTPHPSKAVSAPLPERFETEGSDENESSPAIAPEIFNPYEIEKATAKDEPRRNLIENNRRKGSEKIHDHPSSSQFSKSPQQSAISCSPPRNGHGLSVRFGTMASDDQGMERNSLDSHPSVSKEPSPSEPRFRERPAFGFSQDDRQVADLSKRSRQHRREFMIRRSMAESVNSSTPSLPPDHSGNGPAARSSSLNEEGWRESNIRNPASWKASAVSRDMRSMPKSTFSERRKTATIPIDGRLSQAGALSGLATEERDVPMPKSDQFVNLFQGPFELFCQFRNNYPEYKGTLKHFLSVCDRVNRLTEEGHVLPQCLWDDYIIRHHAEYGMYMIQCHSIGMDPDKYEVFYNNIKGLRYTKGVVTREFLNQVVHRGENSSASSGIRRDSGSSNESAWAKQFSSQTKRVSIYRDRSHGKRQSTEQPSFSNIFAPIRPSSRYTPSDNFSVHGQSPRNGNAFAQPSRKRQSTDSLSSDRHMKRFRSDLMTSAYAAHEDVEPFEEQVAFPTKSRRTSTQSSTQSTQPSVKSSAAISQPAREGNDQTLIQNPIEERARRSLNRLGSTLSAPHNTQPDQSKRNSRTEWWQEENTPFKMYARSFASLKSVNGALGDIDSQQLAPVDVLSWSF